MYKSSYSSHSHLFLWLIYVVEFAGDLVSYAQAPFCVLHPPAPGLMVFSFAYSLLLS
jgi:hypothetical protein